MTEAAQQRAEQLERELSDSAECFCMEATVSQVNADRGWSKRCLAHQALDLAVALVERVEAATEEIERLEYVASRHDDFVAVERYDKEQAIEARVAAEARAEAAERREATIRKLLGRYPEMTDAEAADAAGDVAALFFSEQGVARAYDESRGWNPGPRGAVSDKEETP